MSRLFKGYCTEYLSASQVQQVRVRRYQTRTLTVDFNGAIPKDEVIESVRWDCTSPWATYIYDAAVSADQKSSTLKVDFNFAGWGGIKATATTDEGTILNYEFFITVKDAPLYPQATYNLANGPYFVVVSA
jgi:agmatine/peptidylarginine deiminase